MENFKREIFEQLGNLFYAIARDQHVAPLEFGKLKMLLKKDWLTDPQHMTRDGVTEAAHLIVLTMDTLQVEAAAGEDAFNAFTQFYIKHREQFTVALKEKIVTTAMAIADVFPSGSRLKNNHIIKLKLLFENSSLVV
jgi:hypothetical protein